MANYQTAALLTAQTQLSTKYNEAEMRRKLRPTVQLGLQNQDFSIKDAATLRSGEQRPVEVHYLKNKAAGASVVKATRHTGNKGDADKVTLVWVRFTETFSFSHKLMFNKVIGSQAVFNHEVEMAIKNLQDRIETASLAYLTTNRCQLLAAGIETSGAGAWQDPTTHLQISTANKAYFIQQMKTFMYGRHYRDRLDFICDLRLYPHLERVANQGAGNQTNTSFQFDGVNIYPTTDPIVGAITTGQGLVMPAGQFSIMPWNDPLNRRGHGRPNDYVGMVTTFDDPYGLNMAYDVSVYSDRADTSAIDGNVQDFNDEWEFSACVAFALPPLSLTDDSVVHLIASES